MAIAVRRRHCHLILPLILNLAISISLSSCASSSPLTDAGANDPFDVRRHLSTVTRYDVVRAAAANPPVPSSVPDGCSIIHLNVVARHGTRAPTKKRIKELDRLAKRLTAILHEAKQGAASVSLHNIPAWIDGWESPWKGRERGGELVSLGEEELYNLGRRTRERFPELFSDEYHPDTYSIRATQVPRASASAVAFGLGLFSEKGNLGPGKHRAFSVLSESRASDLCLRFFDTCETYKEYRKSQEPAVEMLKEPILDEVTSAVVSRYQLNFTRQDVASLWFLCKQEASLLDITNQACGLFSQSEVHLLEWTDDLEGFLLKGYGKSINYRMGVPLLKDVVNSMEEAITAVEGNYKSGTYEKARLRFAHAETVVPFTCLLGLFLDGSEFEQIQREEALSMPLKPPQERSWKGGLIAPFAANNMLGLYRCPNGNSRNNSYFVQVLHNEAPIPVPGCGGKDFCPFELFKENIYGPHCKQDYDLICKIKREASPTEVGSPCSSFTCKLLKFLRLRFSRGGYGSQARPEVDEL